MQATTRPATGAQRSDKYVEIPPNASRTLSALRELGYESYAAICDLIDNSIDAKAQNVWVDVRVLGKSFIIEIRDDGKGMDYDTLVEAIRLGSDTDHAKHGLGKYGMGLTTASLSLAKTLLVFTRQKGQQAYEATFDVSVIEKTDEWLLSCGPAKSPDAIESLGDVGTVIRLSNVDRIDDTNHHRFCTRLIERIGETFRRFIADGLKVYVNRRLVTATDPLMREHLKTKIRLHKKIALGNEMWADLVVVELPDLGDQEESLGIVPRRSGFYIMRNGRQIMSAQTLGLYQHHHSYSHFRAELLFNSSADSIWHVDVKKTSVHPNDEIIDKIRKAVRPFIEQSGREGRDRAVKRTRSLINHDAIEKMLAAPNHDGKELRPLATMKFNEAVQGMGDSLFTVDRKGGIMSITYNKRHPIVQHVSDITNSKAHAILDIFCFALAETGINQREIDRLSKIMANVVIAGTTEDTWERRDGQHKK